MCALFRATYARGGQGLAPGQVSAPGQGLVSVDDCGKMIEALVLQILTAWQMCGKSVRNQWFTVAVAAITSRSGLVNAVGEGEGAGKGAAAAATSFGLQGLGNMSATAKAGHGLVVGTGIALGGVQGLGQPVVPYSAQGLGQGLFSTYPPTSLWPGMTLPGGGFTGSSSYGAGSGGSHGGGGAGKDRSTARKAHSTEGGATGGGRSRGAGGGGRSKGSASGGASTKIGGSVGGRAAASSKSRGAGSAQLPCLQEEDEIVAIAEDRGAQIWDTASGGTAAAAAVSAAKNDHNSAAMMVTADSDSERGVSPSPAHSVDEGGSVGAESGEGTLSVERVRTKVVIFVIVIPRSSTATTATTPLHTTAPHFYTSKWPWHVNSLHFCPTCDLSCHAYSVGRGRTVAGKCPSDVFREGGHSGVGDQGLPRCRCRCHR